MLNFLKDRTNVNFIFNSYAKLKTAIDEITAAIHSVRDERKGGRSGNGGLGSTPTVDDRRERERRRHSQERHRDRIRDHKRDRSDHRYDNYFYLQFHVLLTDKLQTIFSSYLLLSTF